jgi:hypothetical protein
VFKGSLATDISTVSLQATSQESRGKAYSTVC